MTTSEKNKIVIQHIDAEWCKGCGICVCFCPRDVLQLNRHGKVEAERPEDCIACKLCELRCPDLAIQIIEEEDNGNQ